MQSGIGRCFSFLNTVWFSQLFAFQATTVVFIYILVIVGLIILVRIMDRCFYLKLAGDVK